VFELLWRDFFHFMFVRHGATMFHVGGFRRQMWRWSTDSGAFAAWKAGRTGHPLVDANMRELAATGFMSNRGRQNVASFLTQNLGVDWRLGAEYFEEVLNDYDVHSNWGNWLFAAGITGGRVNVFNILKQSTDYDPQGEYIKHWCPELKRVPLQYLFQPWRMPPDVQQAAGCVVGQYYPSPLPDKLRGPGSAFRDGPPAAGAGGPPPANGYRVGRGGHGKEERRSNNRGRRSEFERYG
jgi:deoxyribodipyrimidine photo-lyase